jgi:hypothetical protein
MGKHQEQATTFTKFEEAKYTYKSQHLHHFGEE